MACFINFVCIGCGWSKVKVPSIGEGKGGDVMDVFWNYTLQFTHITVDCKL